MVFGFGKKKSGEIEKKVQTERMVTFLDIKQILTDIEKPIIENAIFESKKIKEKALVHIKNLSELTNKLENDNLKLDDVDRNLCTIINRGKNAVISTLKKETSRDIPDITKYEDVLLLNETLNSILKKIGDVLGLNSRIMHIFAKKYTEQLKNEISEIAMLKNSIHKLVMENKSVKDNCYNIEKMIVEHSELKKTVEQKTNRLLEINSEINQINQIIETFDDEINELKSKKEYNKFLQIENEIKILEDEKNSIKNKIDLQFSKISRPLGKYSYISSFDKPVKKIMEDLIREPFEAITQENKETIIEILLAVSKSTLAGNLSVKDIEKSVECIQETIVKLDEFLKMKKEYFDRFNNLQKGLNIFDMNLFESKKTELQKHKDDLDRLENVKNKFELEQEQHKVRLQEIGNKISSNLGKLTNMKITLN